MGIITYLMLSGFLPFDDESSEREIARQTIKEPVKFPSSIWKNISVEARKFVENLLSKDPAKRMTVKELLEHPWTAKYTKGRVGELRNNSKEKNVSTFKLYATIEEGEILKTT